MTTTEIAEEHGVSRQTIHTYRRTGIFPSPVEGEGSTRPRFREDEVAAFFEANPKQPRKKRRFPSEQQGEPVPTTTARDRLIETLKSPGLVGLSEEEAAELVDSYREAVLREAASKAKEIGLARASTQDARLLTVDIAEGLRREADKAVATDG